MALLILAPVGANGGSVSPREPTAAVIPQSFQDECDRLGRFVEETGRARDRGVDRSVMNALAEGDEMRRYIVETMFQHPQVPTETFVLEWPMFCAALVAPE